MAVQVKCPCCSEYYPLVKGGNEFCTKCQKPIPKYERIYRLRQRYRRPDGKVVQSSKLLGMISRERAEILSLEAQLAARRGVPIDQVVDGHESIRWKDIRHKYMRKVEAEGKSEAYQNDTRLYLQRMAAFWGDDLPIGQITPELFRDFQVHLLSGKAKDARKKPSQATVDRHHAAAKAAWEYAIGDDLPNPFKRVKLFRPDNKITRFLSKEQRVRLLLAARNYNRDLFEIVVVALATGLRRSDIQGLKRSEVDFERKVIETTVKRGKHHISHLSDAVLDILRAIPDNGSEYFWISKKTGEPYRRDWRKPWEHVRRLAGISENFRFHDLRHDAGTKALFLTTDIKAAKELLNHSDIKTTERYAHMMSQRMVDLADMMDPLKELPK